MILLDTDVLSLLFYGDQRILRRIGEATDLPLAITVVTRIEVLRGRFDAVLKAADGAQLRQAILRLEQTEERLHEYLVVSVDAGAAEQFDRLRQNRKLRKIGNSDLLIASIALTQKATLVTRNLRHFQQVPLLQVENWAE